MIRKFMAESESMGHSSCHEPGVHVISPRLACCENCPILLIRHFGHEVHRAMVKSVWIASFTLSST